MQAGGTGFEFRVELLGFIGLRAEGVGYMHASIVMVYVYVPARIYRAKG